MESLRISEIWIYPVKSLGGIRVEQASVKKKGLEHDRRWMLIDSEGRAMTQRKYTGMALFKLSVEGDAFRVSYKSSGGSVATARIPMRPDRLGPPIQAEVWNDMVTVNEVDGELSRWFSHHLGEPCRLVAFPESNPRPVDERYWNQENDVSLADAYPFLIIGQSSLDDLNNRLPEPVPMNRFRPNFVFTGSPPYSEDNFRELVIGKVRFAAVKKSERCVLTTVDQETAEKGMEPLRTLSTYRKVGAKVYFGQNLVAIEEGKVSSGDSIIHL